MTDQEKAALKEAAIWHYTNQMVERESVELGATATPQFISALADLVYAQAETLALDLESFAGHAKRSIINVDDVRDYADALERTKQANKENAPTAKASGKRKR